MCSIYLLFRGNRCWYLHMPSEEACSRLNCPKSHVWHSWNLNQNPIPTPQVQVLSLSPTKLFGIERKSGRHKKRSPGSPVSLKSEKGGGRGVVRGQSGCTLQFKNYPGVSINYETDSALELNTGLWLSPLTSDFRTVTTKPSWAIHGAKPHSLHVVPLA